MSKWEGVDWTKRDIEIAEEVGVTRERVRQVRKKLGIPKPDGSGAPFRPTRRTLEMHDLLRRMNTEEMTSDEIARALGVTVDRAYNLMRDAGVTYRNRQGEPKYDWSQVDWANQTNREIADMMGCTISVATTTRHRYGHPKGPEGRGVKQRQVWIGVDWSQSTKEIARQTGRSEGAVSHARRRYAPETLHKGQLRAWARRRGEEE